MFLIDLKAFFLRMEWEIVNLYVEIIIIDGILLGFFPYYNVMVMLPHLLMIMSYPILN